MIDEDTAGTCGCGRALIGGFRSGTGFRADDLARRPPGHGLVSNGNGQRSEAGRALFPRLSRVLDAVELPDGGAGLARISRLRTEPRRRHVQRGDRALERPASGAVHRSAGLERLDLSRQRERHRSFDPGDFHRLSISQSSGSLPPCTGRAFPGRLHDARIERSLAELEAVRRQGRSGALALRPTLPRARDSRRTVGSGDVPGRNTRFRNHSLAAKARRRIRPNAAVEILRGVRGSRPPRVGRHRKPRDTPRHRGLQRRFPRRRELPFFDTTPSSDRAGKVTGDRRVYFGFSSPFNLRTCSAPLALPVFKASDFS